MRALHVNLRANDRPVAFFGVWFYKDLYREWRREEKRKEKKGDKGRESRNLDERNLLVGQHPKAWGKRNKLTCKERKKKREREKGTKKLKRKQKLYSEGSAWM